MKGITPTLEARVRCVFCQFLRWSLKQNDPGWMMEFDKQEAEFSNHYGLNNDALFEAEADSMRLRQIVHLSRSNPAEAFAQFLQMAKSGSVWSMVQIGHAYEVGLGAPFDRAAAEAWYTTAYEKGSDFALVRAGILAFKRGDETKARAILGAGVARGLTKAMIFLAWIELRLSRTEEARRRARALYERAAALGDPCAGISFAREMAFGRFGWNAIPAGVRSFLAAAKDLGTQIDARRNARSDA
jgi:hypothetical protein